MITMLIFGVVFCLVWIYFSISMYGFNDLFLKRKLGHKVIDFYFAESRKRDPQYQNWEKEREWVSSKCNAYINRGFFKDTLITFLWCLGFRRKAFSMLPNSQDYMSLMDEI